MNFSLTELDRRSLWHPYTKRSALEAGPLPVIVRGEGPYLFDQDGRRYVDVIASWWSASLGHNHPRIMDAIRRQANELDHSILGNLSHPRAVELADRLLGLFPSRGRRVLFASDGASAVEAALKIAVQYWWNVGRPEKNRFASLEEAYHGDTLGAVSVGYLEHFHRPFRPLLFETYRAESPCCGTCAHGQTPGSCDLACFASMERIIQDHADELAAVIIEPLCQCAGGMRIFAAPYLSRLAALCARRDVLLIVDEIATGLGRTGAMFAFDHAAIDPDIVCVGKSLSSGSLPISATVVKEGIYDTFRDQPEDRTFYHGHTFAGNPLAAAAARATLDVYEEERIVERARRTGAVLGERLRGFEGLPGVANVRSLGMIGAIELEATPGLPELLRREMLERGFLMRPLGSVFYFMLPLNVGEEVLEETIGAFYNAVHGQRR
jgi:adenosylmethionine---8-amino-7-oxononanoate aminotransferase